MELNKLQRHVEVCLQAQMTGVSVVPFLEGPPAIGKTQQVASLAKHNEWDMKSVILSRYAALDIMGLHVPDHEEKRLVHYPTRRLTESIRDDVPTILFLDEITNAQPDTIAAVQSVLEDRMIEGVPVGNNVLFVLAGNRSTDGCNARELPRAMKEGRIVTITIERPDVDAWVEWAYDSGIDFRIISFILWNKAYLYQYDPSSAADTQPTPRGYEKLSAVLAQRPSDDALNRIAAGCIGKAHWAHLKNFFKIAHDMPSFTEIITDPYGARQPDNMDSSFGVMSNLASELQYYQQNEKYLDEDSIKNILIYVDNMKNDEFSTVALNNLVKSNNSFRDNKHTTPYMAKYHNKYA